METYLLLARSLTHVQQMLQILEKAGIRAKVRRAGALSARGCGYSIAISKKDFFYGMERLRAAGQKPVKIFRLHGDERTEVET